MTDLIFSKDDLGHGTFDRTRGQFRWRLAKDGCLTIHGSGELHQDIESCRGNSCDGWDSYYDTEETEWPWQTDTLIPKVKKIVFGEGITEICFQAFYDYSNLKEVVFPKTLRCIDQQAFAGTRISQVRLPKRLESMGSGVFARTPLREANRGEFYLDGWLLDVDSKKMKQYKVRPGTKGIAPDIFPWHTEIDELYIPGTVKTIGRTGLMKVKRIYLGCGCPEVDKGRFGSDRSTEIIRTSSVIPWEDHGEPVWSISTFAETECIYARAKEHPQKEHLVGLLNELKEGAQRDALFNCRHTEVKNGRLTPEAYKAQSQIAKDMDLLTMSGWIVKTFQTREEKQTVDIVLKPSNGVMCVTVLGLLHKLEKLEPLTDVDSSFTIRIQLPKALHDQAPFQAFLEILKKLFSWIGQIAVTTTDEKCPYYDWYVPVGGVPVPAENTGTAHGEQLEPRLYCRKCGTRLPLDSVYCYRCGTKVTVFR